MRKDLAKYNALLTKNHDMIVGGVWDKKEERLILQTTPTDFITEYSLEIISNVMEDFMGIG